jgi:ElaB/YqjD/DUF883 family membrane-anchored ribosome-binding protein
MTDKSTSTTPPAAALTDDLRSLLQEAEEALGSATGEAGEKFDQLRDRLRVTLNDGRNSLDRLRAEAVRRAKQADQVVRDNPYYAVGVAAGIGALVGILVTRSCQQSR